MSLRDLKPRRVPNAKKSMAQVKLNLREKSLDDKADLADLLVTKMTGNAGYPQGRRI